MWVMTAYQICTLVDRKMGKCGLVAVRDFFFFVSPVEDHDRNLCTFGFYFGNVLFELFFAFKVVF